MATDLYETLELSKNANPEQIRKAYKKKALQTHPDRLPPGATSAEKAASEEQFRKVNNAYEVLNDPQSRRVYDLHGIWPPPEPVGPEELPRRSGSRHRSYSHHHHHATRDETFSDPFFRSHRDPFSFVFTDPFTLFDSIFGGFHAHHHSPQYLPHRHSTPPRPEDPFERVHRMQAELDNVRSNFERGMFPTMASGFPGLLPQTANFPSLEGTAFPDSSRGRWAGESFMTTTVNGVSQSIHKRRDWNGNEHITRTYPDGREIHTINGLEQPQSTRGYISPHSETHHRLHPPAVSQPHLGGSRSDYLVPPPPYPGHAPGYGTSPTPDADYGRRRDRRYSETRPVIPNSYTSNTSPDFNRNDDRHRKRWWRGGR